MWIIVEGATCSGKSTLEKELTRQLGKTEDRITKVHMERPLELNRRWALREYVLNWEAHKIEDDSSIIADRWHWGESTYAPIYRPDTNKDGFGLLGVAGWRWVELFLMSRGALTVFLRADHDVLMNRYKIRGDDHVTNNEELLQIAKLYDQAFVDAPTASIGIDTSLPNRTQGQAALVIKAASQLQEHVSDISAFRGYIGGPKPSALLVGDERNVTKRYGEETKLPFMPVNGNSGDFLLRSLPDAWWPHVGIVNSAEYPVSLPKLWEALGEPPVVALGNNAEKALTKLKIPHGWAYHPQYVRRFEHKHIDNYGKQLRVAAER
jgi:thymidylate kinase